MSEELDALIERVKVDEPPRCADYDEDCADIGKDGRGFDSHLTCHLYDPQRGYCPFLRDRRAAGGER